MSDNYDEDENLAESFEKNLSKIKCKLYGINNDEQNEDEGGLCITLANGTKLEYIEDAPKVTIDYRFAVDVTDEKNKKIVIMGSYETNKCKRVFINREENIFTAFVDILDLEDMLD